MNRLRALLPLLLMIAGFGGIGALAVRRVLALGVTTGGALVVLAGVLYAGWLAWESRVSAGEIQKGDLDRDRGTMELAAAAKLAVLVAALLPATVPGLFLGVIGLATTAIGIALRASAIRALGASYGHRIRAPALPLVERGPYARLRHPAYAGTLLAHTGLVLVLCNAWSIAALLLAWYPAVFLRTALEDRYLRTIPAYAAYAARVRSRLFPRVL